MKKDELTPRYINALILTGTCFLKSVQMRITGRVKIPLLPYIYHPIHLAEQMDTEDEICVALLHDVMEDTAMTPEELRAEGFSESVVNALLLMTHDKAVPYMDYVKRIKQNPLAAKVKLADLRHNSDVTRLDFIDDKVIQRVEKYKDAIEVLFKMEISWEYYLRDDKDAIIRSYLDRTEIISPTALEWRALPPDNPYMREVYLGQGNNCLTSTTENVANKTIGQWKKAST